MRPHKIKIGTLFALLLLGAVGIWSQETPQILTETSTISLESEAPTQVQLEGKIGDVVLLTAVGTAEIDTTLTLLNADGEKIAYADDYVLDGNIVRDARMMIRWTEDTPYTLLIDGFNGVSEGEIMLELERFDTQLQLSPNETIEATLFAGDKLYVVYEAETAENVIISVVDISSTLDPMVRILDANGQLLALGDDNTDPPSGLNTLDTQVTVALPMVGVYVLEVTDFLGREGQVEITLKLAP